MDLRIFTEPQQGATYDDLLAVAKATEDLGFDAFFRSDHLLAIGGHTVKGGTGPSHRQVLLERAQLAEAGNFFFDDEFGHVAAPSGGALACLSHRTVGVRNAPIRAHPSLRYFRQSKRVTCPILRPGRASPLP